MSIACTYQEPFFWMCSCTRRIPCVWVSVQDIVGKKTLRYPIASGPDTGAQVHLGAVDCCYRNGTGSFFGFKSYYTRVFSFLIKNRHFVKKTRIESIPRSYVGLARYTCSSYFKNIQRHIFLNSMNDKFS